MVLTKKTLTRSAKRFLHLFGVDITRHHANQRQMFPPDFDQVTINIISDVEPFTLTSPERIFSLCEAVKYLVRNQISGDIVECGVWKGGSMMAIARMLMLLGDMNRNLYLYDTFDGMSAPTEKDVSFAGKSASRILQESSKDDASSDWCYASLEEVQAVMDRSGYNKERIHFIKGMVEETIPEHVPESIALIRLDTDWYESTRHELKHLFPRLCRGGVLIIDDYGHWKGARQAVDEYFKEKNIKILLNRIDYTARIGVKL